MLRYDNSDGVNYLQYAYSDGRLKNVDNSELSVNLMSIVGPGIPRDSTIITPPIVSTKPKATLYKEDTTVYSGSEYKYDSNGNIIYDGYHGLNIRYNHLNLPRKISRGDDILVNYVYLADGSKYSALKDDGTGFVYEGSFIYKQSEDGSLTLESIPFNGGRFISNSSGELLPRYFITDHLGSVRGILNENFDIEEQNDYYQFGKHIDDPNSQLSDNRYHYNGKENQEFFDLPYLDYGARLYDPHICRWLAPDPLAEKYPNINPYVFCANNPVNLVDPDGRMFDWYETLDEDLNRRIKYTELTSQQALDNAGINGRYLGQAVVQFDGSMDERLGSDFKLTGEGANPAKVTIYGVSGENDISVYNGLTVSSDPQKYSIIDSGDYIAEYQDMATSPYGEAGAKTRNIPTALTYRVKRPSGSLVLNGTRNGNSVQVNGVFMHRTNWSGNAKEASQACLVIDGRSWRDVENQLKRSNNIYIILNRK